MRERLISPSSPMRVFRNSNAQRKPSITARPTCVSRYSRPASVQGKSPKSSSIILKAVRGWPGGLVFQAKTVRVYRDAMNFLVLSVGDTLNGEDVLPGFKLSLTKLFAR